MKKSGIYYLAIFLLLFTSAGFAQDINKVEYSEKAGSMILLGECNRDAFSMTPFQEWYTYEYEEYEPDMNVIEKIKKNINLFLI